MPNSKPFSPKLGSARPRLSAALQQAGLQPFIADPSTLTRKLGTKPPKPSKGKIAAALLALKGQF